MCMITLILPVLSFLPYFAYQVVALQQKALHINELSWVGKTGGLAGPMVKLPFLML